jgi:hypothetical protein
VKAIPEASLGVTSSWGISSHCLKDERKGTNPSLVPLGALSPVAAT